MDINHDDLLRSYAEICSQAIERHRDSFPFRPILDAFFAHHQTRHCVDLHVVDRGAVAARPYILYIEPSGRCAVSDATQDPIHQSSSGTWYADYAYLYDVVTYADKYVGNPALLNWEWLQAS